MRRCFRIIGCDENKMKICIFSDSHGFPEPMIKAIKKEKPVLCFFLGDGERDVKAVQAVFPSLPFYAVRGNCDPRSALSSSIACTVGGISVFATHGHLYNVKHEPALESLASAARAEGAALVLYGHTHTANQQQKEGITFLNPGALAFTSEPSYAVLTADKGNFTAEIRTLS